MSVETESETSESPVQITLIPVTPPEETAENKDGLSKVRSTEILPMLKRLSPELTVVAMVYFVQGFVALASLVVSFFLKDYLQQGPAEVAFLGGLEAFPWMIKPLYGLMSDFVPLFGYRRRSYLIVCGLLSASAWMLMGTSVGSLHGTAALLVVASAATACSDVVADSLVVEYARGETQETAGSLQSLCWASWSVGAIASSYLGGYFVQTRGPQFVFRVIAVFPMLVALSAFVIKETPQLQIKPSPKKSNDPATTKNEKAKGQWLMTIRSQIVSLWKAIRHPSIYLPALFMFAYNATPSSSSAFFFFETNTLHFTPEFLGRVAFIGQITRLGGVGIYRSFLRSVPLKKTFKWCCIVSAAIGMTQLIVISRLNTEFGLSDQLFVLGDSAILQAIGQVAQMPLLVLSARICPEGVEATLFAFLMSILNAGSVFGDFSGGCLTKLMGVTETDYTYLPLLTFICMLSNLLPLFLINLIPDDKESSDRE